MPTLGTPRIRTARRDPWLRFRVGIAFLGLVLVVGTFQLDRLSATGCSGSIPSSSPGPTAPGRQRRVVEKLGRVGVDRVVTPHEIGGSRMAEIEATTKRGCVRRTVAQLFAPATAKTTMIDHIKALAGRTGR